MIFMKIERKEINAKVKDFQRILTDLPCSSYSQITRILIMATHLSNLAIKTIHMVNLDVVVSVVRNDMEIHHRRTPDTGLLTFPVQALGKVETYTYIYKS